MTQQDALDTDPCGDSPVTSRAPLARRLLTVLAALVLAVTAQAATAGPAAAGESNCNFFESQFIDYWVGIPRYDSGNSIEACWLKRGDNDVFVKALQRAYNICYKSPYEPSIAEDGSFGAITEDRVRKIQRLEGITVDGIAGEQTKWAMKWPVLSRWDHWTYQGWCWEKY